MKKIKALLLSCCLLIIAFLIFNYTVDKKFDAVYRNASSRDYGNVIKNQGLRTQKSGILENNSLMMYGSSELSSTDLSQNPVNFFPNNDSPSRINIVGRGYVQDLQHSINIAAVSNELKNKKIVYVVSLQWFLNGGIGSSSYVPNFSDLQFYTVMYNDNIDNSSKKYIAKRVYSLLYNEAKFKTEKLYCKLYLNDSMFGKIAFNVFKPYYYLNYKSLVLRDKLQAIVYEQKSNNATKDAVVEVKNVDWNEQFILAESQGERQANNNPFYIENEYFNKYYRDKLKDLKGYDKTQNLSHSTEYGDYKLLTSCKMKLNQ